MCRPGFCALAVLLAVTPAAAQGLQFGGKVGPSFTTIVVDDDEDEGLPFERRIAAAGGGFVVLPIAPRLALQVEALTTPRGTRLEPEGDGNVQTLLLRYLEFPVLLRVSGPRRGGQWYLFGGGYTAIRLSAKEQLSSFTGFTNAGTLEDIGDAIERVENGLIGGAGVDLGKYLLLEGRYARGLTNVNKVDGAPPFSSRALTFLLGVRF